MIGSLPFSAFARYQVSHPFLASALRFLSIRFLFTLLFCYWYYCELVTGLLSEFVCESVPII